jgi:glycerol-3-phosphate dehydrogenase
VIGGGATGVGIAVDAATRNYRVALVEQHDFGKGTSSRSTKLAHGGVRYLEQGNVSLVREALHERGRMIKNAPHLVHPLPTIVPLHSHWERFYYGVGLKIYDLLSGRLRLGPSRHLSLDQTVAEIPTLETQGIVGGIRYFDGAFDDARNVRRWESSYFTKLLTPAELRSKSFVSKQPPAGYGGVLVGVYRPPNPRAMLLPWIGVSAPVTAVVNFSKPA